MDRNILVSARRRLILYSTLIFITPGIFSSICDTFLSKLVPTPIASVPVLILLNHYLLDFCNDFCLFVSVGRFQCKLTAPIGTLIYRSLYHSCQLTNNPACTSDVEIYAENILFPQFRVHALNRGHFQRIIIKLFGLDIK